MWTLARIGGRSAFLTAILVILHSNSIAFAQGRPDIRWMKGLGPSGNSGTTLLAVAYSADGATMIRVTDHIQVARATDGMVLRTFPIGPATWAAISRDGSMVAVTSPSWVRLYQTSDGVMRWQRNSGRIYAAFAGPGDSVVIAWTPDNTRPLYCRATDGTDAFTGPSSFNWVAMSPDGSEIAINTIQTPGAISFYSLADGSALRSWSSSGVGAGPYAPSGTGLLRGTDWNANATGSLSFYYQSAQNGTTVATLPGRTFTTGAYGNPVWLNEDLFLAPCTDGPTNGYAEGFVDLFSISGASRTPIVGVGPSHGVGPYSMSKIALSPNGGTMGIYGTTVGGAAFVSYLNYYDPLTGAPKGQEDGHKDGVSSIVFSPGGRTVASTSADGTIRLWDRLSGHLLRVIQTTSPIFRASFSPDGTLIAGCHGFFGGGAGHRAAQVWKVSDGSIVQTFNPGTTQGPVNIAFSHDGKYVVTADYDNYMRIYSLATGDVQASNEANQAVACSPIGNVGALRSGASVNFFSIPTGAILRSAYLGFSATSLAFSADGKTLVAAGNGWIGNVVVATGALSWTPLQAPGYINYRVGIEPAGRYAISSYSISNPPDGTPLNGKVRIFRLSDGSGVKLYDQETGYFNQYAAVGAAWSPDGEGIAYTRWDGMVVMAKNPFYALPKLSSVAASPASVAGGGKCTATITLDYPAPVVVNDQYVDGAVVTLTSSNPALAQVPDSVLVPSIQTKATFPVTTFGVTSNQSVTITARYNGVTKTKTITLIPPSLSKVAVSPTSVLGGVGSTGTVTLTGVAGTGGLVVALSSNSSAVSVPASVTVPEGQTTATFAVTTAGVAAQTNATITATYNAVRKTAALTVKPAALTRLSLSPTLVKGGVGSSTATVTLSGPAPPGGLTVNLSSVNGAVAQVPPSVIVPAGASTVTFTVTTSTVAVTTTVAISAQAGSITKTANLKVTP